MTAPRRAAADPTSPGGYRGERERQLPAPTAQVTGLSADDVDDRIAGSRELDDLAPLRGRPAAVWTLALGCGLGTLLTLISVLVPAPGRTMTVVDYALVGAGATTTAVVWFRGARMPRFALHLVVVFLVLASSFLVVRSVTGEGAVSTATSMLWYAIYIAVFFPRRVLHLHLVLQAVGLGVAFSQSLPTTRGLLAWVLLVSSSVLAAEALSHLLDRLRHLNETDPLTGALNRTGLRQVADRRCGRSDQRRPLAVALLDLDGFKRVNDLGGHHAGDRLLVEVVRGWQAQLRPGDRVARLGGDEFAVLLPDTDDAAAERIVERLTATTAAPFTAGIAVLVPGESFEAALERADAAMYARKRRIRLPDVEDPVTA